MNVWYRLIVPNTDPYRTDVNFHAPTEDKVLNDSPRGSLGSPNQSHNLSGCLPTVPDSGHGLLRPLCMYIRCEAAPHAVAIAHAQATANLQPLLQPLLQGFALVMDYKAATSL